jgi:hypothetical protein
MKTAVEWLMNELFTQHSLTQQIIDTFEHAKEIEKEQINNAHYEGSENYRRQYYNETFKSEQCK